MMHDIRAIQAGLKGQRKKEGLPGNGYGAGDIQLQQSPGYQSIARVFLVCFLLGSA
jgi:hypothetical protein